VAVVPKNGVNAVVNPGQDPPVVKINLNVPIKILGTHNV